MLGTMTTGSDPSGAEDEGGDLQVSIIESRAVDEMVGKIVAASEATGAGTAVERWLAEHPAHLWSARGHNHAVVDDTLMYLHDAPDGTVIPHVVYKDGRERVYTDLAHAEDAYRRA
jgi:hypothetical protein